MQPHKIHYFVPQSSHWPLIGSIALFFIMIGFVTILHNNQLGYYLSASGTCLLIYVIYGWFNAVINESLQGLHNQQMDRTYRWGMLWFIVSEIAFFAAFFGALFYTRAFSIPALGGLYGFTETHTLLWPHFKAAWPLLTNPAPSLFPGPHHTIPAWRIPALNTGLLLSSALMITWAHWGLKQNHPRQLIFGVSITILLGLLFLGIQAYEYTEAYTHLNLTLQSGIYGTTFFMLTGFHAVHVTIGLIMLTVILVRCIKKHFTQAHHFGFAAVSWYWHFVDVVWLFLFVFVYWL